MRTQLVGTLCLFVFAGSTDATSVYRCDKDGVVTYTDRPCDASSSPHVLPDAIVVRGLTDVEQDLARRNRERIERNRSARDRADEKWLKDHAARKDRAQRVRSAIIAREVERGMTANEVRHALGTPDEIRRSESHGSLKETWTYRKDRETRTVNFKNGAVTSTSAKKKKAK